MIVIENKETGETREIKPGEIFRAPWRVKGTLAGIRKQQSVNELKAKVASMAASWGLPVESLLSSARWLLGKNCPFCEVGGEFLALVEKGIISEAEGRALVMKALDAKEQKDGAALDALKGKLRDLRQTLQ